MRRSGSQGRLGVVGIGGGAVARVVGSERGRVGLAMLFAGAGANDPDDDQGDDPSAGCPAGFPGLGRAWLGRGLPGGGVLENGFLGRHRRLHGRCRRLPPRCRRDRRAGRAPFLPQAATGAEARRQWNAVPASRAQCLIRYGGHGGYIVARPGAGGTQTGGHPDLRARRSHPVPAQCLAQSGANVDTTAASPHFKAEPTAERNLCQLPSPSCPRISS